MVKERRCERDAGATGGEAGENAGGRAGEGRGGFQAWGGARRVGSAGDHFTWGIEERDDLDETSSSSRIMDWSRDAAHLSTQFAGIFPGVWHYLHLVHLY